MGAFRSRPKQQQSIPRLITKRSTFLDAQEFIFHASRPDWLKEDLYSLKAPAKATDKSGTLTACNSETRGTWALLGQALVLDFPEESGLRDAVLPVTPILWKSSTSGLILTIDDGSRPPLWLLADKTSEITSKYAECPICFFELYRLPVGILKYHSLRSCKHYFHAQCVMYLMSQEGGVHRECPVCDKRFTEVRTLPDVVKDPRTWFQMCDVNLDGTLDKEEVMESLGSVLPVDRKKLRRAMEMNWTEWDVNNDGDISLEEFIGRGGLRDFIVDNFKDFSSQARADELEKVPDLDAHPKEWFDYWDVEGNASLSREEFIRAAVRTFSVSGSGKPIFTRARIMRNLASTIWHDLGYGDDDLLSFETFTRPYGLADQIYHNVVSGMYFGDN